MPLCGNGMEYESAWVAAAVLMHSAEAFVLDQVLRVAMECAIGPKAVKSHGLKERSYGVLHLQGKIGLLALAPH